MTDEDIRFRKIKKNKTSIVMEYVYIVEHVYEQDGDEEVKFIGVFSSMDKAQTAIDNLASQKGFNDHPLHCFKIEKTKLDRYEWKEGFIDWNEAME